MMHPLGPLSFLLLFLVPWLASAAPPELTDQQCSRTIVETIPEGMDDLLRQDHERTHEAWIRMIDEAKESIQIAAFYMTLTPESPEHEGSPSSVPGGLVLEALERAAKRQVKLELVIGFDAPPWTRQSDLERLKEAGAIIHPLNITKLYGDGVQHSKYIIVDGSNFYLGSANMDWRSLAHVKEVGIIYRQCAILANELVKIFKTYVLMADAAQPDIAIPDELASSINLENPLSIRQGQSSTNVYFAIEPKSFDGQNSDRTEDLKAILDVISSAKRFLYISVMKFKPVGYRAYWPVIENAIRNAFYQKRLDIRISVAKQDKLYPKDKAFFRSLIAMNQDFPYLSKLQINFFNVPKQDAFQASVPFARIKHDKFVVTDNSAYVGTSNWEEGYFENTCGVGLVTRSTDPMERDEFTRSKLRDIFLRDWESKYSENFTLSN